MAVLIPACLESNLDVATGSCTAVVWIPQPTLLPDLSLEDAQSLGASIALLWAVAYAFRLIRKSIL